MADAHAQIGRSVTSANMEKPLAEFFRLIGGQVRWRIKAFDPQRAHRRGKYEVPGQQHYCWPGAERDATGAFKDSAVERLAGAIAVDAPRRGARHLFGEAGHRLAMVRAVAPHMRRRRAGVIVNVSSTVTVKTLPLIGVYSASEAVNAFTASLALEMQPFGVRAHLVLPGRAPQTHFGDNAMPHLRGMDDPDYSPQLQGFVQSVLEDQGPVTYATDVAQAVWRAATDPAAPLRIAAGADAELWMAEAGLA
ncbi:hypothetical protein CFR74_12255 [Novacetimonas hansenii]|nr:hypothetical protein CFR74_12255 [Novacetimonas hansenii]